MNNLNAHPGTFRYLHDVREGWRDEEPSNCIVCGNRRPGYLFVQMLEEEAEVRSLCEPCLAAGRLAETGLRINEADQETLRQQLREQMPESSEEARSALAAERTAEVEQRTPRPRILNLFEWPAHCGDYYVYLRQVDADDVTRLAPDGDGKAFLASHLQDRNPDEEFITNVWEDRLKGFMRFYLWQCPQCSEYLLTCDCE